MCCKKAKRKNLPVVPGTLVTAYAIFSKSKYCNKLRRSF